MILETFFPQEVLTNSDLEKAFPEWTADKIEQKVGIVSRHVASEDETPLDMAEKACIALFQNNPGIKESVDYLLFCTQNPDYILPGNSSILQNRLGLSTSIGAFDYNLGCSGFVYGLSIAKALLKSGIATGVLLLTAEAYTRRINSEDKGNRSIFGDAATASFLNKDDANSIGEFVLGTDGSGANNLIIKNGGLRHNMISAEKKEYGSGNIYTDNDLYMDGPEIFNFTIEAVPPLIDETMRKNGLKKEDVKLFIFHQANSYILSFLRKIIRIPSERFYLNMKDTGNTVSSTIPIAIKDAIDSNLVQRGDRILVAGFGVGYSYGATIITLP